MKRKEFKFEIKILVLLVLGVLFVSVVGVVTYNRLTRIVTTLRNNSRPEVGLLLTHVIQNDVNEISNMVRSRMMGFEGVSEEDYTVTKLNLLAHLDAFKKVNESQNRQVITEVDSLINYKIIVSDELFYSEDAYRVQKALSKVVKTIGESINSGANEPMKVKETVVIKERVVEEKVVMPTPVVDEKKKKKLFGNKKNEKAKLDSVATAILAKTTVEQPIQPTVTTTKKIDTVGNKNFYHSIYDGIRKVKEEELAIESRLKGTNFDWISLDENLERELNLSFNYLKRIETEELNRAAVIADQEAHYASRQILFLAIFISLLLFGLGYLILKYVRRNVLYQEAIQRSSLQTKEFAIARENYMSNISHELRTPMHAIQGFAELLAKEQLESSANSYVKMIQKSSQHMGYLINDVLDLAKLRNDKIKVVKEIVSLKEIIDEVWSYANQINQKEQVDLQLEYLVEEGVNIEIDAFRLRQILLNLLSNAIKFTHKGFVRLQVCYDNSELVFKVEDTGIGMNESELESVFDEYTQANAHTAHQFGGTGLGLTITKRLVDLLDGRLTVQSEVDKGTQMIFSLPISLLDFEVDVNSFKEHPIELKFQPNVLIVDDEVYNRKLLEGILKGKTQSIFLCHSAEQAMDVVVKEVVDLILLDFRLPGLNGAEFVKWIKDQKLDYHPKIVILSAAIGDEVYEELLTGNVDGVLDKPFTANRLYEEINRIFNFVKPAAEIQEKKEINFLILKQLFGQDNDFYIDMLQTFISSSDESIDLIKLALQNEDFGQIGHEAHKMASPTKHLGATDLYTLLKMIEKESSTNTTISFYKSIFKDIEKIYIALKAEIILEINRVQN